MLSTAESLNRRQFVCRSLLLLASTARPGALLAACGRESEGTSAETAADASPSPASSALFRFGTLEPVAVFDPHLTLDAGSWLVRHIVEPLLLASPYDRSLSPLLAAEMPSQKDERTWVVNLRPDATFHNGELATAADVAFSYNRGLDPELASPLSEYIDFIESVNPLTDDSVEFRLRHRSPVLAHRLALICIVPQAVVGDVGNEHFNLNPVGTGPMLFVPPFDTNHFAGALHE